MKIFLLSIIFLCCVIIGVKIFNYYSKRKEFYNQLCIFCEKSKIFISYSQEKLGNIINFKNCDFKNDFYNFLLFYEKYLNNQISLEEFKNYNELNFLSNEEKSEVLNFFSGLGNMTREEEIEKIELSNIRFLNSKNSAFDEHKKFSMLYVKLFIIIGFAFVIIFI